jgi:hypothetical protein
MSTAQTPQVPQTQKPLWLKLKKEYVDDNFDDLVPYLKEYAHSKNPDSFYEETLRLLHERVKTLVQSFGLQQLYEEVQPQDPHFEIRLLAAYLLTEKQAAQTDEGLAIPAYVVLMHRLMKLYPQSKYEPQIAQNISKRLCKSGVLNYGFGWDEIIRYEPNTFAYKAVHNRIFSESMRATHEMELQGTAILDYRGLHLSYLSPKRTKELIQTKVAELFPSDLSITLLAPEKLKQSQPLREQQAFVADFCSKQQKYISKSAQLPAYSPEDDVVVRITQIDKVIHLETTDPNYKKIEGVLEFKQKSIDYYYVESFFQHFKPGDYMHARVKDVEKRTFTIDRTFTEFLNDDCHEHYGIGGECLAQLIDTSQEKKVGYVWLSQDGYPIYTEGNKQYQHGDFAYLRVERFGTGNFVGKIDGHILEDEVEAPFDEQDARTGALDAFTHWRIPEELLNPLPKKVPMETLSPDLLSVLVRFMFAYQKTLQDPKDRFAMQMCAWVMSNMIQDELSVSYLRFTSTYLLTLVQFANDNQDFKDIKLVPDAQYQDAESTRVRLKVVELLKLYGKNQESELLEQSVSEYKETQPLIAKLAQLIQAANVMKDIQNKVVRDVIRREIVHLLAIETENNTDLKQESGEYLGVESGTQEFKQSMVYAANDQMQPNPTKQSRNVMRGVCAFLNSESGGTLYVGVSDLGYVTGIEQDMTYLRYGTIDAYLRYIQDQAIALMGEDVAPFLHIEAQFDNRCVAIRVESYPYDIVRMEGVAYLRINAESREMTETMCTNLIARKKTSNADQYAETKLRLSEACRRKQQIYLDLYNQSARRRVEVYNFQISKDHFTAYDVTEKAPRIFKVKSIRSITDAMMPWQYEGLHAKVEVDDFRTYGTEHIEVHLQLDAEAMIALMENFPECASHLKQDKGEELWYYDATVFNIEGVGRYYLSLSDHIKYTDCPRLDQFVKQVRTTTK